MSGKRVLVVDDSVGIRQEVATTLATAGFAVVEAVDGLDGILKFCADPEFSAVLCDINMPRMTGLEMIEKLHEGGTTSGVPIVMLTTEAQPSLIERAKRAGAKGWIIKPFKPSVLIAMVNKMVARS